MQSILVAVGRMRKAEECLQVAARIASDTGAILHAIHPLGPEGVRHVETADRKVLVERILRRIPAGVTVGTVQVVARSTHEAVLDGLRTIQADLVVASPTGTPAAWLDPGLAQVVLRSAPAVLIHRESTRWPPRRALVPLLPDVPVYDTLSRAGTWAQALWGARTTRPALEELRVLHVPGGVDELHDTGALVELGIERLKEEVPAGAAVRLTTSIRWGARPLQRIVRSREFEDADLLVLDRTEAASATGSTGRYPWFQLLASAPSSVLLLPAGDRGQHPRPAASPAFPDSVSSPIGDRTEHPAPALPVSTPV